MSYRDFCKIAFVPNKVRGVGNGLGLYARRPLYHSQKRFVLGAKRMAGICCMHVPRKIRGGSKSVVRKLAVSRP